MPGLLASARDAVRAARELPGAARRRLVVGGRSMGGRVASLLVAEGLEAAALVLLSYPLHPAGKPEQLRDAHLPAVRCPMLFVQGDRDALCDLTLLRRVLERIGPRADLRTFAGGDHGMRRVPPGKIAGAVLDFLGRVAA